MHRALSHRRICGCLLLLLCVDLGVCRKSCLRVLRRTPAAASTEWAIERSETSSCAP
jgi:hypothetical protein